MKKKDHYFMTKKSIIETVISSVYDDKIQNHITESPIWLRAYHESEMTNEIYQKSDSWYKYSIKFNGLIPMQCTKIEKFKLNKK